MAKKVDLLIVDPQNSFCKIVDPFHQQVVHDGELCIGGAWEDMRRLATLVNRLSRKLNDIHVTMDSHHLLHVAHPIWFRDAGDRQPEPFTVMREENGAIIGSAVYTKGKRCDIGEFTCFSPSANERTLEYLKALRAAGRYQHRIWPPHCLLGTPGHNIVPHLMEAIFHWEQANHAAVNFVMRGENSCVEHFSAVQAEIVDPTDPATQLNTDLIQRVMDSDEILIAGEAGSHALAETVRDIAGCFLDGSFVRKSVLLTDAMSPSPGFEAEQQQFIDEMSARGMKTTTTTDYVA